MVTTSLSDGRRRITSALMGGPEPEQSMAWTECAWVVKNWSVGSGDSHDTRRSNFLEKRSLKKLRTGGSFRTMTCGRSRDWFFGGGGVGVREVVA